MGVSGLAAIMLALAPSALARDSAKFKVLSLSGTSTTDRHMAYEPSRYGDTCSFTQTERISFHSTKPLTAYAFTSKSHGRARVEWSPKPEFSGNLVELEVPGEMTVSRTATYQQSIRMDPDTGEAYYGCYSEVGPDGSPPADCAVERTFPVTLRFGGTSDTRAQHLRRLRTSRRATSRARRRVLRSCIPQAGDDPRLFSRAALFNKRLKRVKDTDRVEEPGLRQRERLRDRDGHDRRHAHGRAQAQEGPTPLGVHASRRRLSEDADCAETARVARGACA